MRSYVVSNDGTRLRLESERERAVRLSREQERTDAYNEAVTALAESAARGRLRVYALATATDER